MNKRVLLFCCRLLFKNEEAVWEFPAITRPLLLLVDRLAGAKADTCEAHSRLETARF
jgi:hypothetical protein